MALSRGLTVALVAMVCLMATCAQVKHGPSSTFLLYSSHLALCCHKIDCDTVRGKADVDLLGLPWVSTPT